MARPRKNDSNSRRLPYTDPRSLRYYDVRAGKPLPPQDWYRNTKNTVASEAIDFSQERFVSGFHITVMAYYDFWKLVLDVLLKGDFYEHDFQVEPNAKRKDSQ